MSVELDDEILVESLESIWRLSENNLSSPGDYWLAVALKGLFNEFSEKLSDNDKTILLERMESWGA